VREDHVIEPAWERSVGGLVVAVRRPRVRLTAEQRRLRSLFVRHATDAMAAFVRARGYEPRDDPEAPLPRSYKLDDGPAEPVDALRLTPELAADQRARPLDAGEVPDRTALEITRAKLNAGAPPKRRSGQRDDGQDDSQGDGDSGPATFEEWAEMTGYDQWRRSYQPTRSE